MRGGARLSAAVLGVGIASVGVAGYLAAPGGRTLARHGVNALGIFEFNRGLAYLYLLAAFVLLASASRWRLARTACVLTAAGFLVLALVGALTRGDIHRNYFAENGADVILHFVLTAVLGSVAWLSRTREVPAEVRDDPALDAARSNPVERSLVAAQRPPVTPASVQIYDYLRLRPAWGWAMLVAPVLVGAATVAILLVLPVHFAASATVTVPSLVGGSSTNQFTGSSGAKTFFAQFQATARSPVVVAQVAAGTGYPASIVSSCLGVSPLGASVTGNGTSSAPVALLSDTCTASRKVTARAIARADAIATLKYLFTTQAEVAGISLHQAHVELLSANAALLALEKANGPLLDQTYVNTQLQLHQTQQAEVTAIDSQQPTLAAALQEQAKAAAARLAVLAPKVAEYDSDSAAVNQARTRYADAEAAAGDAVQQLGVATSSHAVTTSSGRKVSRSTALVKVVGPATAGGLLAVLIALLLTELLGRNERALPHGVA